MKKKEQTEAASPEYKKHPRTNLIGFFRILIEWDRAERARQSQTVPSHEHDTLKR